LVAAYEMADASTRRQFGELMNTEPLDDAALDHWRSLIFATGAVQWIEDLITTRVDIARKALDSSGIDHLIRTALSEMAGVCTRRAA
jgi:geranylgeranyl diphosphate synthase type I